MKYFLVGVGCFFAGAVALALLMRWVNSEESDRIDGEIEREKKIAMRLKR